jgi:hypothetical protein
MEHHVDFIEDEDFLKLTIDIVEESMGYLPSIPAISDLFKQILNSAGMRARARNENLNISSSHLTYHLDSLKELFSKNDSGYKLSVFGRAAVRANETF